MEVDKKHKCRLCLSDNDVTDEYIFDSREGGISLSTKIMMCTSLLVTMEDHYPKYICSNCADMLDLFFHFRDTCFKTHVSLQNTLNEDVVDDSTYVDTEGYHVHEEEENIIRSDNKRLKNPDCSNIINNSLGSIGEDVVNGNDLSELGIEKVVSEEIVFDERERNGKEIFAEKQFQVGCYVSLNDSEKYQPETGLLRRFKCINCKRVFSSLIELDDHWDVCGNLTEKKNNHMSHSDENITYEEELLEVPINDEESTAKKNIRSKEFFCDACGQVFKQLWLLTRHIQVKHIGVRPYSCPQCTRKFFDKYELKYHQRLHEDIEDFCCNVCGRRFSRRSGLRIHMRSHTGEKPYECGTCGKSFAHLNSRITHERVHTGERPYSCKYCPRTFVQYSTAKSHEEMHMGGLRIHQCEICDRMYRSEKELQTHTVSHEGAIQHICTLCNKGFRKLTDLKKHKQRFHIDNKPHKCQFCSKSYMTSHELRAHITLHTGELPFTCLLCSKRYRLKATLRKHMDKHHRGIVPEALVPIYRLEEGGEDGLVLAEV